MKHLFLVFITLFSMTLVSCGGDEAPKTTTTPEVKKETPKAAPVEPTGTITLSSNDKMQFDKAELSAKAGEQVTLTLVHTGKMPKASMGHNFVLLKKGTVIADFAKRAMSAKDTDYVPEGDEAVIASTTTIGGGESVTITFTAPEAGVYDYICSFPGHYGVMKGKFTFK